MKVLAIVAFVGVAMSIIAAAVDVFLACRKPPQPNMVQSLISIGFDLVLAVLFGVIAFLARNTPKGKKP